jgi:hypothetical protein
MFRLALTSVLCALAAASTVACDSSDLITWRQVAPATTKTALRDAESVGIGPAFEIASAVVKDHAANPGCPTLTMQGATEVYEGQGCTTDHHVYTGRLERTVTGDTTPQTARLVYSDFTIVTEKGKFVLDGTVDETATTATVNLRFEDDGVVMHFDAAATCTSRKDCKVTEGARGSIDGLGEFTIDLQKFTDRTKNVLVLTGVDSLSLGNVRDADDCLPYTIDGQADPSQRLCPQDS